MIVFDSHCDTLTRLVCDNMDFSSDDLHVNSNNINPGAQVFACFINPDFSHPLSTCLEMIDRLKAEKTPLATGYASMKEAVKSGKTAAFLSVEGVGGIGSDLFLVRTLYELGVRFMSLTWNGDNCLGGGADGNRGLTGSGAAFIREMNHVGMVLDVSHLSQESFYDAADVCNKPFIASHSNSYAVCPHRRNLTDEQFKIIKKRHGMVGINFYPPFLSESENAGVKDVILHIEHFLSLGGEDCIGLGSDFDGIDFTPENLTDAGKYGVLYEGLLKLNYPESLADKIFYKNYMIFVKNNL